MIIFGRDWSALLQDARGDRGYFPMRQVARQMTHEQRLAFVRACIDLNVNESKGHSQVVPAAWQCAGMAYLDAETMHRIYVPVAERDGA